jgi:hypothetical protein
MLTSYDYAHHRMLKSYGFSTQPQQQRQLMHTLMLSGRRYLQNSQQARIAGAAHAAAAVLLPPHKRRQETHNHHPRE